MADIEGYITKESAIETIQKDQCHNCPVYPKTCRVCKTFANKRSIMSVPAADVRPVIHAFWVGEMDGVGICSNCKRLDHIDPLATHCRYCGASMRKQEAYNGS